MTAVQPAAVAAARADAPGSGAPVIVLTYGQAGARRLQAFLDGQPELACTTATGLLAACDQAAAAWRQAERRPAGQLSALAITSLRTLASAIITTITAAAGRPRWCETSAAERSAAETFLRVFPATRFLCLHRAFPDVAFAVLSANPWGVSGPGFAAYTAAHPASTLAALAAWWAGHTAQILAFEQDHPDACRRIRYEDLAENPGVAEHGIREFLGLKAGIAAVPALPGAAADGPSGADAPGCGAGIPAAQIPPPLLHQVNNLHARLGYPALPASP